MHRLIHGDCVKVLLNSEKVKCIFADPPDGIDLGYDEFDDKTDAAEYVKWLRTVVSLLVDKADVTWLSFNARWTVAMGAIVAEIQQQVTGLECKPCVQVFTFGQHNHHDLGNNHRPLWRLMWRGTELYPDQIRVPSWRQLNGDKRADPRGRVPGDVFDNQYDHKQVAPGDVFDFPRVTGNSKQRCNWHPTQLHEELVERCIKMSTREGESVLDPFGGTGTTLRVCKRINRNCTLIEFDSGYCEKIAADNDLSHIGPAILVDHKSTWVS